MGRLIMARGVSLFQQASLILALPDSGSLLSDLVISEDTWTLSAKCKVRISLTGLD